MNTSEIIRISEIPLGMNELKQSEIGAIYKAANADAFWMISYAYALGFMRGSKSTGGYKMKWTEAANKEIAELEKEKGIVLKPEVVQAIKITYATCDKFGALGAKDAAGGYEQRTKDAFIEWGKRELIDPVGKDHPIVELMYMCYTDGYNSAKEGHYV